MSRWTEIFNTHALKTEWEALKISISELTVDDKSVITNVEELARLKKVISFIDGMMKSLDPELVPIPTWDACIAQITPCRQNIDAYALNRNIAYISAANTHADNLLTYIRPYNIPAKQVGKILHDSIQTYAKTLNEYGESFRVRASSTLNELAAISQKSESTFNAMLETKTEIDEYRDEVFEEDGLKEKLEKFAEEIEEKNSKIRNFHNETFVGTKEKPSIEKNVTSAQELVLADQKKIQTILEKTSEETIRLSDFFNKIFGKMGDDGKEEGGINKQLDDRISALGDFEQKQIAKYNALNTEIESLLPGATNAGLATAYKDMKDSFDTPIKTAATIFYIAIGILIFGSLLSTIESIDRTHINFVELKDWDTVLKGIVYKLPFYAPVLWLAFFATKRRSEYQRLQQEYAHKEALAKSYNSYKKQINELDVKDIEMQKMFITKAIDAISYNASSTLDGKHGDKMPAHDIAEKLLEKFDAQQILEFMKCLKKV